MASFQLVTDIKSKAEFDSFRGSGKNIFLFFWAPWHEPSKLGGAMHTIVAALAEKYPSISFFRIEAEGVPAVSELLDISVVPSFVGLAGESVVGRVEGTKPPDISKLAKLLNDSTYVTPLSTTTAAATTTPASVAAASVPTAPAAAPSSSKVAVTPELANRIRFIVGSSPVMLFMKGSPSAPRCGFSRQIVEILQANDIPFASFDILGDEAVRAGLKELYDWPTYPQLYVKGELAGGLDIVKEMVASGTPLREQLGIDAALQLPAPRTLDDRLRALLNQAPVMLFMKGNPAAPRCGFSRTICGILQEQGIAFESFDILEDEEVRAGLKVLSDWPTYPQLYVKGVLVGGLDIVKEMASAGPLAEQLEIA